MDTDVASAGLHPGGLAALGTRGKGLVLPGAALLPSDKNQKYPAKYTNIRKMPPHMERHFAISERKLVRK